MKIKDFREKIKAAVRCYIGLHNILEKSAVTTMGAVFVGGLCPRCLKVKVGKFICNIWDEAQTQIIDNAHYLRGTTPKLIEEGWKVYDYCQLESIAEILREKRKKSKKPVEPTAA